MALRSKQLSLGSSLSLLPLSLGEFLFPPPLCLQLVSCREGLGRQAGSWGQEFITASYVSCLLCLFPATRSWVDQPYIKLSFTRLGQRRIAATPFIHHFNYAHPRTAWGPRANPLGLRILYTKCSGPDVL